MKRLTDFMRVTVEYNYKHYAIVKKNRVKEMRRNSSSNTKKKKTR